VIRVIEPRTAIAETSAHTPAWRSNVSLGVLAGVTAGAAVAFMLPAARWLPLLVIFALAAGIDWRTRRIPNWLTAGGGAFALLTAGGALGASLLGAAVALGAGVVFVVLARGAFGMGDVKLLAVAGAATGAAALPGVLLVMSIAGGVLALWAMATGRGPGPRTIAYGPAIAVGAAAAIWLER